MISFEGWVSAYFAPSSQNDEVDEPDPEPPEIFRYLSRLFRDAREILRDVPDETVAAGLYNVFGGWNEDVIFKLRDGPCPWPEREPVIRSLESLFRELFPSRCTERLCHLDETGITPLNGTCYMWWDVAPFPNARRDDPVNLACLEVMKAQLLVPHEAVQESGLHGLGHWTLFHSEIACPAITAFLEANPHARPELRAYAENAREGRIL